MTWTTSSAPTAKLRGRAKRRRIGAVAPTPQLPGESPILSGMYPIDGRDAWSEHEPFAQKENEYIRQHDYSEYARCHLGIDDEHDEDTKGRYKFPCGDFEQVHRCGLLAAEPRAGQQKYYDIELAVAHLHGMLEALSKQRESTSK